MLQDLSDPTLNVKSLLKATVERLDDLRYAETKRVDEQMNLRAEYAVQLNVAEAKRIDAIRAVDVNAVAVANERATAQAAVLAQQVAASAEALRALVAATAATAAQQLSQLTTQLTDRLTSLEKSQYENSGRQGIGSPLLYGVIAIVGGLIIFLIERSVK